MSDPQDIAESLDDDELPTDLIPDEFIEPEDWDAGAGSDADDQLDGAGADDAESEVGQEREGQSQSAEDAAMHIERGNASD